MKKLKLKVLGVTASALTGYACDVLVVSTPSLKKMPKNWSASLRKIVTNARDCGHLEDVNGAFAMVPNPHSYKAGRLLVVRQDMTRPAHELIKPLHRVFAALAGATKVAWWEPEAQSLGLVAQIAQYQLYRYRYGKDNPLSKLDSLTLLGQSKPARSAAFMGQAVGMGRNLMRELAELPGNVCTPAYLGQRARQLGKSYPSLSVKVHNPATLKKLGMNTLLQVGLGSGNPPRLIEIHYKGKGKGKPIVLVGKGITFDTGGISIKPGGRMDEMKFDMSGAASVFGAMLACAEAKISRPVIGLVAAAENMPDGLAGRPGDVVRTMSGKTVEILNTDAEGRMALCDALTYAKRFKPKAVVDLATLTGACVVALGHVATGLMSNDDELADALLSAGERSGDRAWRLPLWSDYKSLLNSEYADLANIGGPSAGTITAGCFLQEFVDYPWAHLDIAGTAWPDVYGRKRSSGRAVPLLMEYLTR